MADPKKSPKPPASAYANVLRVMYAQSEFFLSFGQLSGPKEAPSLVSSVVTTPLHAKAMLKALEASVERYEDQFGEIPTTPPRVGAAPAGSSGTTPPRRPKGGTGRKADAG